MGFAESRQRGLTEELHISEAEEGLCEGEEIHGGIRGGFVRLAWFGLDCAEIGVSRWRGSLRFAAAAMVGYGYCSCGLGFVGFGVRSQ